MGLNEAQKRERSEYLEHNLEITECSQRKPYVFISYASDNWEQVFKSAVVPMQREYGLRVYADRAFDTVNDKWIVPMLRNVRGADVMVAFVSQNYIESYACFLELLTAANNKKQIVFVSLGEQLHLGDTTDLPNVERGVKKEILNQGANIATNTNNTSNDLMRAIKSAFTSISTLLEQDALSKYDISDAFINFFRDAAINYKSINDLIAVKSTIRSISGSVFDKTQADKLGSSEPNPGSESASGSVLLPDVETVLTSEPDQGLGQGMETVSVPEFRPASGTVLNQDSGPLMGLKVETLPGSGAEMSEQRPGPEIDVPARGDKWQLIRDRFKEWKKGGPKQLAWISMVLGILTNALIVMGIVYMVKGMGGVGSAALFLGLVCSIVGIVLGIQSLKFEKKKVPVTALVLNGFVWAIILIGICLNL